MKRSDFEPHLKALGWTYSGQCGTCSGVKYNYTRNGVVLAAYPGRDFYEFRENDERKTGKLSQLSQVVKAAKDAANK